MTSLNVNKSESFPEDLDFVRNKTFKNSSVINNYESDDEQNPDYNDEEQIRNSFFKNGFQDETYQDELFGENASHVIINNSNDLTSKEDDSIESKADDEHNDFRMSPAQLFEVPKKFDATVENVTNSLKHNEEILGTEEEIDSIFESVSVAYENRMKNLENEVEFVENELKHYPEFDAIDEKLMRELLELSIDDQHQPFNSANQNFAASSIDQTSPNDKLPTSQFPKSNFVKQSARLASPSSARLKESQRKLSDVMRKLNTGKSTNKQINISNNNQTSSKSKPLLFRPEKSQSATISRKSNHPKTQISPRPSSCIAKGHNNSAKNKQNSPNIWITPRPAFRAGSLTDFSRKIDDDGRRTVAGKNNPYRKLKPTFSHKASYVDEMLFGQNSSTQRNSESAWQAPWQAKLKPSRPHFCDWVYDRRKPQNT